MKYLNLGNFSEEENTYLYSNTNQTGQQAPTNTLHKYFFICSIYNLSISKKWYELAVMLIALLFINWVDDKGDLYCFCVIEGYHPSSMLLGFSAVHENICFLSSSLVFNILYYVI